jgi:epoxide hydrolase-like predicted phosphatase
MISTQPADRARRGLLIDYGGVLTTSVFESFRAFELAENLPPDAVARLLGQDERAAELLRGLETGGGEAQFEAGLADLLAVPAQDLIPRLLGGLRPEPAMIDTVRELRRAGVRTALVSNSWGAGGYPEALFGELFDALVISGQVGLRKPDPAIYLLAAEKIGAEPGECVFVDDLPGNLEPAARLGMAVVRHLEPAATRAALGRLFTVGPAPAQPR